MKKRIILLGSTGSIGKSVLEIVKNNSNILQVVALSCYSNIEKISQQVKIFQPEAIAIVQKKNHKILAKNLKIFWEQQGIEKMIVNTKADLVVVAISGYQGIYSTFAAIKKKIPVAIANKEPLVIAGKILTKEATNKEVPIYPIDSEHNAVFQCLEKGKIQDVKSIIITASGGPFLNTKKKDFAKITLKQCLKHPKWKMGVKNTLDSATTMNKALEIIEAKWLFGINLSQIKVLVHPQSIVHAIVQYKDGSSIAQLANPDMKVPISYCLGEKNRLDSGVLQFRFIGSAKG